jgi:hypothetical protein
LVKAGGLEGDDRPDGRLREALSLAHPRNIVQPRGRETQQCVRGCHELDQRYAPGDLAVRVDAHELRPNAERDVARRAVQPARPQGLKGYTPRNRRQPEARRSSSASSTARSRPRRWFSIRELAKLTDTRAPSLQAVYACVKLLNKVMLTEGGGVRLNKAA